MDFICYIWLMILLFLRPGDFLRELDDIPLFWISSVVTLLFCFPKVMALMSSRSLRANAALPLLLIVWMAFPLSHIAPGRVDFDRAYQAANIFFKPMSFFIFTLAIVNTQRRLILVCRWITFLAMILSALAIYDYHYQAFPGVFNHAAEASFDSPTGVILRLAGSGTLGDPNDYAVFLVFVSMLNFDPLLNRKLGLTRVIWLIPLVINVWAFALTQSRGAFLSLLAAVSTALFLKFGVRRSMLPLVVVLPALFASFGGRMTNLTLGGTTGQERIEYVGVCFDLIKKSPIFGIGYGETSAWLHGKVAHNTYMQTMAELGTIWGSVFALFLFLPLLQFIRMRPPRTRFLDPAMARLYLFYGGCLAGFLVGILSLSRAEVLQTYLILGLGTAFGRIARREPPDPLPGFRVQTFGHILLAGFGVVLFHYLLLRYFYGVGI